MAVGLRSNHSLFGRTLGMESNQCYTSARNPCREYHSTHLESNTWWISRKSHECTDPPFQNNDDFQVSVHFHVVPETAWTRDVGHEPRVVKGHIVSIFWEALVGGFEMRRRLAAMDGVWSPDAFRAQKGRASLKTTSNKGMSWFWGACVDVKSNSTQKVDLYLDVHPFRYINTGVVSCTIPFFWWIFNGRPLLTQPALGFSLRGTSASSLTSLGSCHHSRSP